MLIFKMGKNKAIVLIVGMICLTAMFITAFIATAGDLSRLTTAFTDDEKTYIKEQSEESTLNIIGLDGFENCADLRATVDDKSEFIRNEKTINKIVPTEVFENITKQDELEGEFIEQEVSIQNVSKQFLSFEIRDINIEGETGYCREQWELVELEKDGKETDRKNKMLDGAKWRWQI